MLDVDFNEGGYQGDTYAGVPFRDVLWFLRTEAGKSAAGSTFTR
jgi:hypothetical protein